MSMFDPIVSLSSSRTGSQKDDPDSFDLVQWLPWLLAGDELVGLESPRRRDVDRIHRAEGNLCRFVQCVSQEHLAGVLPGDNAGEELF